MNAPERVTLDTRFPQWVGNGNAALRQVDEVLFVGGRDAILYMAAPPEILIDFHQPEPGESTPERDEAIRKVCYVHHVRFEDGRAMPRSLIARSVLTFGECVNRGMPMLVSCSMGCSRSVSLAYALLRIVRKLEHAEALRRVVLGPTADEQPAAVTLASVRDIVEIVHRR